MKIGMCGVRGLGAEFLELFGLHPDVGMIGAYDKTPNGDVRDTSSAAARMKDLHQPKSLKRRIKNVIVRDEFATISKHIERAITNGYNYGEHCLGGGFAKISIRTSLLSRSPRALASRRLPGGRDARHVHEGGRDELSQLCRPE